MDHNDYRAVRWFMSFNGHGSRCIGASLRLLTGCLPTRRTVPDTPGYQLDFWMIIYLFSIM